MPPIIETSAFEAEMQPPSLEETYQSIMGLRRLVLEDTARKPVDYSIDDTGSEADIPDELQGEDEIDRINRSGIVLLEGLADPDTVHLALDSFLSLETIRRAEPELAFSFSRPGELFDERGAEYLDDIIDGDDKFAAITAARLVISRAIVSPEGAANLDAYLPRIIQLMNKGKAGDAEAEAVRLYEDLSQALLYDQEEHYYIENMEQARQLYRSRELFRVFMGSLGYAESDLTEDWRTGSHKRQLWARQNILCMLLLEDQEPGLSKK